MRYWLMKSEPDCYSIDDVAAEKGPAIWEGCRNYTVRNFFRDDFKVGDLAFFHNSNSNPAGVAGVMKITGEAEPDPTQFDPNSMYFDPKSKPEAPRWLAPRVSFEEKFDKVISMADMREIDGLEDMWVLRKGQRLSVMPVTEKEWDILMKAAHKKG